MFFLLFSHSLYAQYSVSANDDNAIKWRQIRTKSFRLVYPDFYEDDAQKLARILLPLQVGDELQKKNAEHLFYIMKYGIL